MQNKDTVLAGEVERAGAGGAGTGAALPRARVGDGAGLAELRRVAGGAGRSAHDVGVDGDVGAGVLLCVGAVHRLAARVRQELGAPDVLHHA